MIIYLFYILRVYDTSDLYVRDNRVGNLVFLSARPHVYKSVSENVSYDKFRALQKERGLYTSPSLLAGSLDTGMAWYGMVWCYHFIAHTV